ncbi:MAG: sugar transferase [candidate division Zixibacteria bacterium]|nr:sugar transferase [candidate division Zixibacteria bacterium]
MVNVFLVFIISFVIVFGITPKVIRFAHKVGFLDYPTSYKLHKRPTPLLGGVVVYLGFIVSFSLGIFLSHIRWDGTLLGIFLGSLLLVLLGLWDDKKGLSPSHKLFGHISAALLFIFFSQRVILFTNSFLDALILLLWIVGLINALNFLDNMDGLCGGITFIHCIAFFVIGALTGQMVVVLISLSLAGAVLAFLKYNFRPAKIFLGDAGSMLNGFLLACMGVLFAQKNPSPHFLLVPILILSYPIFDITFVTFTRLREGRKVYIGGKDHSTHRMVKMGIKQRHMIWSIYLTCLALGALAVLVYSFFDSPFKMLITVFVWLILTIFGVHLLRNFVNIGERLILIFSDMIMINAAFLFFFWAKFNSGLFANQWSIPLSEYVAPAIWITIFWLNLFAVFGLYEVPGDSRFIDEMKGIAKASAVGIILFLILTSDPSYLHIKPWILLLIYSITMILALGLGRGLFTYMARKFNFLGVSVRKAIIVGTKQKAKNLFEKLTANSEYGYQVVGFVKEDQADPEIDLPESSIRTEGKVLGRIEDIDEIARENKVQNILIAVEPDWRGSLQEIMNSVHNLEVSFKIVSDLNDLRRGYQTAPLRSKLLLRIFPSHMRSWEWLVKRLLDGLVSLTLLVVFLPLWIIIALLVRSTFKTFPLVKQRYVGKMGRRLELYKFRVGKHYSEGENKDQPSKIPPSKLGRFLRNSGLEKAPIFINILKGEMSLVGPEPLLPETFEDLSTNLPHLPKRLYVKPGLLSLAKIKGRFKDYAESARDYLQDDLFYMENMSLLLDFKILVKGMVSFLIK